jgi:hypothetical protein
VSEYFDESHFRKIIETLMVWIVFPNQLITHRSLLFSVEFCWWQNASRDDSENKNKREVTTVYPAATKYSSTPLLCYLPLIGKCWLLRDYTCKNSKNESSPLIKYQLPTWFPPSASFIFFNF